MNPPEVRVPNLTPEQREANRKKLLESLEASDFSRISKLYDAKHIILTHIIKRGSDKEHQVKDIMMRAAAKYLDEEIHYSLDELNAKLRRLFE